MKKLIALQITLILLLTAILSACGVNETTDISSNEESNAIDQTSQIEENSEYDNSSTVNDNPNYTVLDWCIVEGNNFIWTYEDTKFEYIVVQVATENGGKYKISSTYNIGMVGDGIEIEIAPNGDTIKDNQITVAPKNMRALIAIKTNGSSTYEINVEKIVEPEEPPVTEDPVGETINGITYYFENEDIADIWRHNKIIHDYCTCGATTYWESHEIFGYYFAAEALGGNFMGYCIDKGIVSAEEMDEFLDKIDKENKDNNIYTRPYVDYLPYAYRLIKNFNITKDDYLEYREQEIAFAKETGYGFDNVFTDRQIEIIFGNYSDEIVMQEFKNEFSYYHDGKLYHISGLIRYADDETLKELLKEDGFKLWLYDVKNLSSVEEIWGIDKFLERIESLRAEMEAE